MPPGLAQHNICSIGFRWAGFPKLERHAERPDVRDFVEVMTKDLERF